MLMKGLAMVGIVLPGKATAMHEAEGRQVSGAHEKQPPFQKARQCRGVVRCAANACFMEHAPTRRRVPWVKHEVLRPAVPHAGFGCTKGVPIHLSNPYALPLASSCVARVLPGLAVGQGRRSRVNWKVARMQVRGCERLMAVSWWRCGVLGRFHLKKTSDRIYSRPSPTCNKQHKPPPPHSHRC